MGEMHLLTRGFTTLVTDRPFSMPFRARDTRVLLPVVNPDANKTLANSTSFHSFHLCDMLGTEFDGRYCFTQFLERYVAPIFGDDLRTSILDGDDLRTSVLDGNDPHRDGSRSWPKWKDLVTRVWVAGKQKMVVYTPRPGPFPEVYPIHHSLASYWRDIGYVPGYRTALEGALIRPGLFRKESNPPRVFPRAVHVFGDRRLRHRSSFSSSFYFEGASASEPSGEASASDPTVLN